MHMQMVEAKSTLNKVVCQIEDLYENKTSKLETLDHEKTIQSHIKSMLAEQTKIFDAMNSLENWVEKYLPLKLQHQISETVGDVIVPENKQRLTDVTKQMSKQLRKAILEDKGTSMLRQKCLDLLTNLRLEQDLLNLEKDGPNLAKKTTGGKVVKLPSPEEVEE